MDIATPNLTSSTCEIVPMRAVSWHSCLRKASWKSGVVTGIYRPPGIAGYQSGCHCLREAYARTTTGSMFPNGLGRHSLLMRHFFLGCLLQKARELLQALSLYRRQQIAGEMFFSKWCLRDAWYVLL